LGWPEFAPYNVILIAAAADKLPENLKDQVRCDGRIIAPIGDRTSQQLKRWRRKKDHWDCEDIMSVRFVPLIKPHHE